MSRMSLRVVFLLIGCMAFSTLQAMHHLKSERIAATEKLLDDPKRPDSARDAGRKPAQVIEFLGIKEGMTMLDLWAAGGYYTEVLSKVVGPGGKVYSQNTKFLLEMRDGVNEKTLSSRLADDRLANVERVNMDIRDLKFEPGSLDGAMLVLNFHDIANRSEEAVIGTLRLVAGFLKPDGFIGLIDHIGTDGNDNAKLHRIKKSRVLAAIEKAGLKVSAESDVLLNGEDDHTKSVFHPDVRGKTDRFLLKVTR